MDYEPDGTLLLKQVKAALDFLQKAEANGTAEFAPFPLLTVAQEERYNKALAELMAEIEE